MEEYGGRGKVEIPLLLRIIFGSWLAFGHHPSKAVSRGKAMSFLWEFHGESSILQPKQGSVNHSGNNQDLSVSPFRSKLPERIDLSSPVTREILAPILHSFLCSYPLPSIFAVPPTEDRVCLLMTLSLMNEMLVDRMQAKT